LMVLSRMFLRPCSNTTSRNARIVLWCGARLLAYCSRGGPAGSIPAIW
jgi:hypothetical protein